MKFENVLRFCPLIVVTIATLLFATSIGAQGARHFSWSGDFIQNFDKDGDGKVSKEEFTRPEKVFDTHDKNQDGYIDESEAPKGPPSRPRRGK